MRVSGNVAQVIFRNDARTDLTKTPFEFSEAPLTPNFVVYVEDNPGTLDDHVNVTGYGPSTCSPPIAQVARLGTVTSGSVTVVDATPPVDTDGDGVEDGSDNCSNVANAGQADADGDDIGDRLRLGQRQRRCRTRATSARRRVATPTGARRWTAAGRPRPMRRCSRAPSRFTTARRTPSPCAGPTAPTAPPRWRGQGGFTVLRHARAGAAVPEPGHQRPRRPGRRVHLRHAAAGQEVPGQEQHAEAPDQRALQHRRRRDLVHARRCDRRRQPGLRPRLHLPRDGRGRVALKVRIDDSNYRDNYGRFSIEIETATPST